MNSSFASLNLHKTLLKNIASCRYQNPTAIQQKAIPLILSGQDLIASAPTGTGKTAAFVLPILNHALESSQHKTRILILTPTRELASQITTAIRQYGKSLNLNTISIVGGTSYTKQFRELSKRVDIIVATPGRLKDQLQRNKVDLSGIQVLVLDEADRMLDMGFIEPVKEIARLTPKSRQTLLFSATVDQQIIKLAGGILNNPAKISIATQKTPHTQIEQKLYHVKNPTQKSQLLQHLLNENNIFKAIIFSATKIGTERLADELRGAGYSVGSLHGDMRQSQRNRTVESLRRGKIQFLVATDVGSRGLDINDITHVVNYHLPRTAEDYVHRIGRTGRAGKTGIAISLAMPEENRLIKRIEHYIGKTIPRATATGFTTNIGASNNYQEKNLNTKKYKNFKFSDRYDGENKPSSAGKRKSFSKKEKIKSNFNNSFKDKEHNKKFKDYRDKDPNQKFKDFRDKDNTQKFKTKNRFKNTDNHSDGKVDYSKDNKKRFRSDERKKNFNDEKISFKPKKKFVKKDKRKSNFKENTYRN